MGNIPSTSGNGEDAIVDGLLPGVLERAGGDPSPSPPSLLRPSSSPSPRSSLPQPQPRSEPLSSSEVVEKEDGGGSGVDGSGGGEDGEMKVRTSDKDTKRLYLPVISRKESVGWVSLESRFFRAKRDLGEENWSSVF